MRLRKRLPRTFIMNGPHISERIHIAGAAIHNSYIIVQDTRISGRYENLITLVVTIFGGRFPECIGRPSVLLAR